MSNIYIENFYEESIIIAELKEKLSDTQSLVIVDGIYKLVDNRTILSKEKYEEKIFEKTKILYDYIINICKEKKISFEELINYHKRIENE